MNNNLGKPQIFPDSYYVDTTEFNGPCYLQKYPVVAADPIWGINPALHYITYGMAEGKTPGCDKGPANPADGTGGDITNPSGNGTNPAPGTSNNTQIYIALAIAAALFLFRKQLKL